MEQPTTEQRTNIVGDDEKFRLYVMETLGELSADMKSVVGNGQPGRLSKLEAKVDKHDWYIAIAMGGGAFFGWLLEHGTSLTQFMAGK